MAIFVGGFLKKKSHGLRDFIRTEAKVRRSVEEKVEVTFLLPTLCASVKRSGKDIKRIYMGNWNWS